MLSKKSMMKLVRHRRVRRKVKGTKERYRLCVFKSVKHIYAQVVDDEANKTIITVSTISKDLENKKDLKKNVKTASIIGGLVAKKCIEKNIKKVVFDRGGYIYHGRIKALADAARKEGLLF
jgi:large subunit ribosomal protein L18